MTAARPGTATPATGLATRFALASAGFWVIVVAAFIVIASIVLSVADEPSSVWQGARWIPQYFVLFLGTMLSARFLPVYIAHGVTRRRFDAAAFAVVLGTAVGYAAIMQIGFLVERLVFRWSGGTQFPDGVDLVAGPAAVVGHGAEFALLYLAYLVTGWAIVTGYRRYGGLVGTVLLVPLLMLPFYAESVQWRTGLLAPVAGETGVRVENLIVLAGVLATALFIHRSGRNLPVPPGPAGRP
ncbi:hypothetical protein LX16_1978 [Stackebrandtia albiflava]|uniref:Uncharacterized protein n=1 Tax=Stackebrandtia albiflava TaxID=406432 RepID=A0A562VEJ8_9ACTN|nr:hypothetical protein [Stackebrandtia albiflava]TWJ16251.1 hypothetical protein LX16_1978 [Stackebrandtia albiflava]